MGDDVLALDASTGAQLWRYTIDGGVFPPAVVNGVVYVASTHGSVYAFSLPKQ
jgi:outer membrane protein assembly factor BamB